MELVLSNLRKINTTIALLSIIPLCVFLFVFSKFVRRKNKEAPIAKGAWPIIGDLPIFSGTKPPHKVLGTLANKYGPIFTIKLGSKHALVINNWEMAKECYTTKNMFLSSRPKLIAIEHLSYKGAMFGFAPYGPYWRELRKIVILEVLTNHQIKQQQHVRTNEVRTSIKELFDVWSSENKENSSNYVSVDLKKWFTQSSFNTVLQGVVGKKKYCDRTNIVHHEEAQRCIKALNEMLRLLGLTTVGDVIPCLNFFYFGGHVKVMKETFKELDKILDKWLNERRYNRTLIEKVDAHDKDIMDVLISLLDEQLLKSLIVIL